MLHGGQRCAEAALEPPTARVKQVRHVTVFVDRAEVTRLLTLPIENAGPYNVVVQGVTDSADADSVRKKRPNSIMQLPLKRHAACFRWKPATGPRQGSRRVFYRRGQFRGQLLDAGAPCDGRGLLGEPEAVEDGAKGARGAHCTRRGREEAGSRTQQAINDRQRKTSAHKATA